MPARRARRCWRSSRSSAVDIPVLFQGTLNTPGTLQLLALMLVFAGLAFTYDLLFGFTGLLSFGHALYFAVGVYVAAIAMTQLALGLLAVDRSSRRSSGSCCRSSLGAVSLRVGGIAFAMVTLAFAQAGSVLVVQEPDELTGGEDGFGVDYTKLPAEFVGIFNTKNLYWLALGYCGRRLRGRALGGQLVARPRVAGDPRERAARRGARPAARTRTS